MNIQRSILEEAVRIYFENGDWRGYIKRAVREQRGDKNGDTPRPHQTDRQSGEEV